MNRLLALSSVQLKRAAAIKDQINTLEKELVSLLGSPTVVNEPVPAGRAKRKLSAAGLARIKAAQKKRWAKIKSSKPAAPVAKKKFTMSAAAKAKISAAAKARWAKIKAAKKA